MAVAAIPADNREHTARSPHSEAYKQANFCKTNRDKVMALETCISLQRDQEAAGCHRDAEKSHCAIVYSFLPRMPSNLVRVQILIERVS